MLIKPTRKDKVKAVAKRLVRYTDSALIRLIYNCTKTHIQTRTGVRIWTDHNDYGGRWAKKGIKAEIVVAWPCLQYGRIGLQLVLRVSLGTRVHSLRDGRRVDDRVHDAA